MVAVGSLYGCSEDVATSDGDFVNLSVERIDAGPEGGTFEVTVSSSADWRVAGVCDWAELSAVRGGDGDSFTVEVDPNNAESALESVFKVFTGSAIARLKVVSVPFPAVDLLSPQALYVGEDGGNVVVRMKPINAGDMEYEIVDAAWLAEAGAAVSEDVCEFRFSASANDTYTDREGEILFFPGEDFETRVTVRQDKNILFEVTPTRLDNFSSEGGEVVITVKENTGHTVQFYSGNFVEQVDKKEVRDGACVITEYTFRVPQNTGTERTATLVIGNDTQSKYIRFTQAGGTVVKATIPDMNFRNKLISSGWAVQVSGDECEVTAAGLAATTLSITIYDQIKSLEGIEAFSSLTSLALMQTAIARLDVSGLPALTSLICDNNALEEVILGDVSVYSLQLANLWGMDMGTGSMVISKKCKISSSKLTSLNMGGYVSMDALETLDVSQCPALQTLDCNRGSATLKTLYLKTGQVIPDLTKNDATQIVYVD